MFLAPAFTPFMFEGEVFKNNRGEYVEKIFSREYSLMTNIKFKIKTPKNLKDNSPFKGASFEMNGTGPTTKNFVMPNELAIKLMMKQSNGKTSVTEENTKTPDPMAFFGSRPSVSASIANRM